MVWAVSSHTMWAAMLPVGDLRPGHQLPRPLQGLRHGHRLMHCSCLHWDLRNGRRRCRNLRRRAVQGLCAAGLGRAWKWQLVRASTAAPRSVNEDTTTDSEPHAIVSAATVQDERPLLEQLHVLPFHTHLPGGHLHGEFCSPSGRGSSVFICLLIHIVSLPASEHRRVHTMGFQAPRWSQCRGTKA